MPIFAKKAVLFLFVTAFIEGAAVMAIEILGAKLIAPFYGASLYVWTATLAVTLSGLATGYFLGAFISDKYKKTDVLFYLLIAAAVLVGLMTNLSFWIMTETLQMDIRLSTVLSLLVFLFPPLVLLGSTSPIIINLISNTNGKAGKSAGTVYAISTLGGIICTFVVGFYSITNFGVKLTCVYTSILLTIAPLFYFTFYKKKLFKSIPFIFLGLIILLNKSYIWPKPLLNRENYKIIYKSDGLLGGLAVIDINKKVRLLTINNTSQTTFDIPTKRGVWQYVHRIATYASIKPKGSTALVCGLGGGALANELIELGFEVDACDFDQRMEYIARNYFYLSPKAMVYIDDARHFIKTTNKKYDIVALDLSYGENVPSNVYTKECFEEIKQLLNKDGFIFLHYPKDPLADFAVKSIAKTFNSAGLHVKLLNTTSKNNVASEVMFFACPSDVSLEEYKYNRSPRFADSVFDIPKYKNVYTPLSYNDGIVMTDDKPLMDILHKNSALSFRSLETMQLTPEQVKENHILY